MMNVDRRLSSIFGVRYSSVRHFNSSILAYIAYSCIAPCTLCRAPVTDPPLSHAVPAANALGSVSSEEERIYHL